MNDNPYASPAANVASSSAIGPVCNETRPASQGTRLANFIVDYLVIWALLLSVYALFGLVYRFGTPGIQAVVSAWAESGLAFALLALTVVLAYYVGTEALFQRTVGKLLTGTMVMTDGGQRPSLAQIVGRSCARLIPFEGFSFLSGQNPAGWHDSLSGTRVVKIR